MNKNTTVIKIIGAMMLLVMTPAPSYAALVSFDLTGDVQAAINNPFGLTDVDDIFATGTYDDSVLIAGSGDVSLSNITFTVGSATFSEADSLGSIILTLSNNEFVGLDYSSVDFISITSSFVGDSNQLAGSWIGSSLSVTPVPVPAAAWLFGSGLIGLAGLAKRRKT